jgi:hypothetical protein
MCSVNDEPPYEPLEDSVDWAHLRWMKTKREARASREEREYGIPPRIGYAARHADGLRHSQARRGWQYDPSER